MSRPSPIVVELVIAMSMCVTATVAMALGTAMLAMAMESGSGDRGVGAGPPSLDLLGLAAVAVASLALGVTLAVVLSRKISRQIRSIAHAAGRLAAGDMAARAMLPERSADEMLRLANSFNAMAAALEDAQGRTVEQSAVIAHELRTPLAVLLGRVQGMQDGVFACDDGSLAILSRQILSLSRLVDDLAVVGLFSAASLQLSAFDTDLAEQLQQAAADMAPRLADTGLTLDPDISPAPGFADPQRVRQAVAALLENVVRHAASGGSVRVESGMTETESYVRVMDRGPGLTEAEMGELLVPFSRGAAARANATTGSGLGLSVVDTIARAHGGEVRVQSREGGGLSVSFALPRRGPAGHQ